MYKLDTPLDRKEAAAIERRRNREQQRQGRIFNAKVRQIGIDVQGLEQQVDEKRQHESRERAREEAFAHDAVRYDKIATLMDARQQADRRALNMYENEFRSLHQQPEARREWDLYDPDALKKDKPARVHDDDPRCTISSLQKFDGEDLNAKARRRLQEEQLREWSLQQQRERDAALHGQREADRLYDLKRRELDQRACELAQAEEACRRAINLATSDYNNALAREAEERARLRRQQEQDDNATEVSNAIFSDMLTENPAVAQSAFGPHRVVPDRWKGMTPEQIEEIRRIQALQAEEQRRKKEAEKREQDEWDRQRALQARTGVLIEREVERVNRELQRKQAEDNLRLAREQKAHKEFLDKELYTNPPTAAYFMQFNTSSR